MNIYFYYAAPVLALSIGGEGGGGTNKVGLLVYGSPDQKQSHLELVA